MKNAQLAYAVALTIVACGTSSGGGSHGTDAGPHLNNGTGGSSLDAAIATSTGGTSTPDASGATGGSGGSGGAATGVDGSAPGCGAHVVNYAYTRPFAPTAAWNVPVCNLPKWSQSDDYSERFWRYSAGGGDPANPDANREKHAIMFGLDPLSTDYVNDFAPPVYLMADATTTRHVIQKRDWNGVNNIPLNETIPWNPKWRASGGSDWMVIILDPATGREWDIWGLSQSDPMSGITNDSQCWGPGYDATVDLCVGSANLIETPDGKPVDYRAYAGNYPARGCQIQEYAMLTMPDEVAAGEIRHALMMPVLDTMFGLQCTPAELGTAAMGHTCGFALAPAGGLEKTTAACGCGTTDPALTLDDLRARAIPEGLRLALNVPDDKIAAWLDSRGYSGKKRETARIFAVALREYGFIISDTSGYAAAFQVAGGANPDIAKKWRDLGIDGDGRDLLDGLFTKEALWAVEPATNQCETGPSAYSCRASVTGY